MVDIEALSPEEQESVLGLIHEHQERTGSARARQILLAWSRFAPLVLKVVPHAMRGAGVKPPVEDPARPLGISAGNGAAQQVPR
jgi:glutamate synthase domain-containing protein 3